MDCTFSATATDRMDSSWSDRLRDYLDGSGDLNEAQAASPHACELGRWLSRHQAAGRSGSESMDHLNQLHQQLHQAVQEAICARNDGDMTVAEAALRQVVTLSDTLQSRLAVHR